MNITRNSDGSVDIHLEPTEAIDLAEDLEEIPLSLRSGVSTSLQDALANPARSETTAVPANDLSRQILGDLNDRWDRTVAAARGILQAAGITFDEASPWRDEEHLLAIADFIWDYDADPNP